MHELVQLKTEEEESRVRRRCQGDERRRRELRLQQGKILLTNLALLMSENKKKTLRAAYENLIN